MVHRNGEEAQMVEMRLRISEQAAEQLKRTKANTKHFVDAANKADREAKKAFQATMRHKRKEAFNTARQSDIDLLTACEADTAALKAFETDRRILKDLTTTVEALDSESKSLDAEIKKLQARWRSIRKKYGDAKNAQHQHTLLMAAHNPERTKAKVIELLEASEAAWKEMSPGCRKKKRNRTARRRAKEICGR